MVSSHQGPEALAKYTIVKLTCAILLFVTCEAIPGTACVQDSSCSGNYQECRSTKCVCVNGYITDSQICRLPRHGEECVSGVSCQIGYTCTDVRGSKICQCPSYLYYTGSWCANKKTYESACVGRPSECVDANTVCTSYNTNLRHCLCETNYFRTKGSQEQCRSISDLKVQNPSVSSRTVSTVGFIWTVNKYGRSVSYRFMTSPGGGAQFTREDGGFVTSLVAGRWYNFSVESYLAADVFYSRLSTTVFIGEFWTRPAKPGGFDMSLSQVEINPMTLEFQPSVGDVRHYKIYLTHGTNSRVITSATNRVEGLTLTLGVTYSYEIVAISDSGEISEKSSGTFKTNPSGWKLPCSGAPNECQDPFSCVDRECDCANDEYYDGLSWCRLSKSQYANCLGRENECKKPFSCVNDRCNCLSTQYYSGEYCRTKKYHGEYCTSTTQCQGSLSCRSLKCTCDFTVDYREGSECKKRKSMGSDCESTIECQDSLSCLSRNCTCDFDEEYYRESKCLSKKPSYSDCINSEECQGSMSCLSQNCLCDIIVSYTQGSECKPKKPHGEYCTSTTQCQGSLSCISQKCACDFNVNYVEGSDCKKKKPLDDYCSRGDDECQSNLSCFEGKCVCGVDEYYRGSTCQPRITYGGDCTDASPKECVESLSCVNQKCSCDLTVEYVEGLQCKPKKVYQDNCDGKESECLGANTDCVTYNSKPKHCLCAIHYFTTGSTGQCRLTSDLQVQNPSVSSRTVSTVGFFWTVNKYGRSVSYRLMNSPDEGSSIANDNGGVMTGLAAGRQYTFFVDSYISPDEFYSKKPTTKSLGQFWTKPAKPGAFDRSLSKVETNPMTFGFQPSDGDVSYYKVTLTHGSDTIEKTPVTNKVTGLTLIVGVTYSYEIVAISGSGEKSDRRSGPFQTNDIGWKIPCSDTGNDCQYPFSCVENKCDCTSTKYFDGHLSCLSKKSKDNNCGSTNECQASLFCVNGKCVCSGDEEFYDGSKCQPRKTFNQPCTNLRECRDSLACINSKCTCNPIVDYDDGTKCKPRKSYRDACDGKSSECLDAKTVCISYNIKPRHCLCEPDYFRTGSTGQCRSMKDLKVQNPEMSSRTVNTVAFTWTVNKYGRFVFYNLINSPHVGSLTVKVNGGSVTGLQPGRQYSLFLESFLPADEFYSLMSTTKSLGQFWTKPAKPGAFDLSLSQVNDNPMTFGFQPSAGDVSKYKVTLTHGTHRIEKNPTTNRVTGLTLTPGKTYSYEIVAISGFGENSEKRSGTFQTNSTVSSEVEGFDVTDITATTATVQWKPPSTPNGDIYAFAVQVFRKGECLIVYTMECYDCPDLKELNFPDCSETLSDSTFTTSQAKDTFKVFQLVVKSLDSYTEYVVKIFAINDAGSGVPTYKIISTSDSAPENLEALKLTSFRDSSTGQVGLMVTWTPGQKTGVTDYVVTLVNMMDDSDVSSQTLSGYDKTSTTFPHVLAFHDYRVTVVAGTRRGQSDPIQQLITTTTTTPGKIQNFKINLDPKYATRMSLEFECPLESERNGDIQGFTVIKTTSSSGNENQFNISVSDCNSVVLVASTQVGMFVVNESYTFKIIAKNQDYEGGPSDSLTFNVVPKPPVLEQLVLEEDSNSIALENAVRISLCSSCITNPSQGEITHAGLIVCVKSENNTCAKSRRKRDVLTLSTFSNYQTWTQAKASQFKSPYRTTPDGWIDTLKNDKPSVYAIGDDKNCTNTVSYCNGPLPPGKDIVVTVIACTVAGCQESTELLVKIKDESDDPVLSMELILAVAISSFVVVMIIIMVSILCRKCKTNRSPSERQSKKFKNLQNTPAPVELKDVTNPERRPIKIGDFPYRVTLLHKHSNLMFHKDFEELDAITFGFESASSQKISNQSVTSTGTIDSQVNLQSVQRNNSDFIKASYIPGLDSKRDYIVTQGPFHGAIPHFWKMVWEQKTEVIVMLSDVTETKQMGTDPYWPNSLKKPMKFGDFMVEMINFLKHKKCIIREFKVSLGKLKRKVTHFCCEMGNSLSCSEVIEFLQNVHQKTTVPKFGPPIIQCSSEIGRTGTFIALDYFMQYIDRHSLDDDIDVFHFVLEMRKCQPHMVQAEDQYIFIFDVLSELIERKISEKHHYDLINDEKDYYNGPRQQSTHQKKRREDVYQSYRNRGYDTVYDVID